MMEVKMRRTIRTVIGTVFVASTLALLVPVSFAEGTKDCDMDFNLKGWSAIYKTAHGTGTITCTNGQSAKVDIKITGGGLTFGKSEIFDGHAEITGVKSISEIYGSYAAGEAHAGVVKSATAQVLTKGNVSIALAGKGSGVDVGVDFSKFTISKAK
jgi:hypothetical protein